MKLEKTIIEGVYILTGYKAEDNRGAFCKIFNNDDFQNENIDLDIKESYYSVSNKGVIRGMHFQTPPYEHNKFVTVIRGAIVDVILDLRKDSKTFGKSIAVSLNEEENKGVYIPIGCAHGFKSLEDNTITLYNVSSGYSKDNDGGVRYDSFEYDWDIENPIISERDLTFENFKDFESPF